MERRDCNHDFKSTEKWHGNKFGWEFREECIVCGYSKRVMPNCCHYSEDKQHQIESYIEGEDKITYCKNGCGGSIIPLKNFITEL